MIFETPKELYEQPLLCCAECLNPVPNDMLDVAQAGMLGPCPNCGSEKLMDNPNAALTYVAEQDYPGPMGLLFVGSLFDYFKWGKYIPKVYTQKKKTINHPLVALLTAMGNKEEVKED